IGQAIDDQTVDEQEDATIVLNDPRETRMTSIGESSPAPVSNSGTKNDRTIIESELRQSGSGSKQSLPPKQKGTHETVSRWESEQRYQLVNNFARGGLGQIWMANDVRLRREVAYKELLPKALRSANAVERFLEEAQITGQLEHPSIVPVYDIGYQQNGTPFYSMKLVRGETMEKHIEHLHELPKNSPEFTLARRRLLGNFIDICNAIAFAHDRGVLHRDLKPLNVMLGAFGETLVLDWGLAKVLDNPDRKDDPDKTTKPLHQEGIDTDCETLMQTTDQSDTAESGTTGPAADSRPVSALPVSGTAAGGTAAGAAENSAAASFTMEDSQSILGETKRYVKTDVRTAGTETMMGSIMGTPAYMPPEQAKGNLDELDARTDIYSLGGILYKLLTNEQPIQKTKAIKKLLERIIAGDITPPRRHDPQIEKPLEAVCLKAMARIQDDRYACALTLAADVEAFLADEPVSCFNDPPLVKARRWMKQNPRKVVSTGTTLAAGFLVWLGSVAVHASTLAEIREFAQDQLRDAQKQEQNNQFDDATTAITEAIGRTGSEPDLSDLTESLNNRLEKIATSQLQHIRSGTEPLLQIAIRSIADGRFEDAQSELVRVQEQTDDHESLKDLLHTANTLWAEAEDEINEKTAITQASLNFTRFRELADETRAYSSLPGSANPREDAQLAMSTGQTALRSFSLIQDQPFREPPRWFEKHLHWVREFHEAHGESPLEVLYDEAFELMILQADLEMTLASNQTDRTVIDAAGRALIWIDRAESIPDHAQTQIAQVWKAVCLRSLGKLEEAAATVATASTLEPDGVLDFFLLGEKARKDSRYDEALRHYLNVIREDPGHFWTRYYMGLCYVQLGYPHAAVSAFSNAVTLEEGNVWPVMMRAVAYAQLQMYEESLSDYTAAIELQPELFNIYVNRGFAYLKMGRHEDALQDYQSAVKLAPESAIPHINIAAWYFERARQIREGDGDFANMQDLERIPQENEALRMAEKALDRAEQADKSGSNPRVDLLRAKIALGRGEEDIALTLFKKHSDLAPTRAIRTESLKQIGFIQFRKQQFPEALAAFQQSLELVSDDAETVFLLGETHLRLRQPE
ncbi:MAG: serine/threonine-protein kinase, partial [Planctomycetaceae bacterium]